MIRKIKYTILALLGFVALRAQVNLVPNPGFEDYYEGSNLDYIAGRSVNGTLYNISYFWFRAKTRKGIFCEFVSPAKFTMMLKVLLVTEALKVILENRSYDISLKGFAVGPTIRCRADYFRFKNHFEIIMIVCTLLGCDMLFTHVR